MKRLILPALLCLTLAGCSLFQPAPVIVPPKVAKTLELAPNVDGPYKGQVTATPEQAKVYADDYLAKLAADEAKAKADRESRAADSLAKAQAVTAAAERAIRQAKARQAVDLQQLVNTQNELIETLGANASNDLAAIAKAQRDADTDAARVLAAIAGEHDSATKAIAAALADQKQRDERRLGFLSDAMNVATNASASAGGPLGLLLPAGLGLIAGWLGLSKPGEKGKAQEAASAKATIQTLVTAVDSLPPEVKPQIKAAIAAISTPTDEAHITEAKTAQRL